LAGFLVADRTVAGPGILPRFPVAAPPGSFRSSGAGLVVSRTVYLKPVS